MNRKVYMAALEATGKACAKVAKAKNDEEWIAAYAELLKCTDVLVELHRLEEERQ
jgi:hypothetical protein